MEPEFITLCHSDGYEATARWWEPAASPSLGAVLYFHGIQSHGGWFERSAQRLAEAGLAVLLPERRGSGRNQRDRGHAPSVRQLLSDAYDALDELLRRSGADKAQLLGASWGAKLALALAIEQTQRTASVTLVGPGLFPIVGMTAGQKMRIGWSLVADRMRRFAIPINEPEMFTATPEWIAFIRDDPLRLMDATASFWMASRKLDRYIERAKRHPGVPLRLFLAGQERIVDSKATAAWARSLGWPDTRIKLYPEAHHTLEFEPDGAPYLDDLVAMVAGSAKCQVPSAK